MATRAEDYYGRLQGIIGYGDTATDWEQARAERIRAKEQAIKDMQRQQQLQLKFNVQVKGQPKVIQDGGSGHGHPGESTNFTGQRINKFSIFPVADYRISSKYGGRTHPVTGKHSNHTGMDFATGMGKPIFAVADGVVRQSDFNKIYGNRTILDFGGGLSSMYGHQSRSIVKPGQRVKRGQIIGYVGSTGLSTGPHLHFETWLNNKPVNPLSWFIWK